MDDILPRIGKEIVYYGGMLEKNIPLSLYIHFPWCVRKCPYCDFNSHAFCGELPEDEYVNALIQDLEQDTKGIEGRAIKSIYMGGGTPSLFSPKALERLLKAVDGALKFSPNIEITMEANPGTIEQKRLDGYRNIGINRLSIGVQSFQDEKLRSLGRIHSSDEAITTVKAAKRAGLENINIDLMFGLPNQSTDDALYDLRSAIALEPTHLSWYQLTLEPNTAFYKNPPTLLSDDKIFDIYEHGQALLEAHGFHQYKISAYSQANRQCQHNRNYWEFGDYLGIGAGAHGKITNAIHQKITRAEKEKNPRRYLDPKNTFTVKTQTLQQDELPIEFMLNALRLYQPIPISLFENHTGLNIASIEHQLNQAAELGLIEHNNETITTTKQGKRFLNDLIGLFV